MGFCRKLARNQMRMELKKEAEEKVFKRENKNGFIRTISVNKALGDRWRHLAAEKFRAQQLAREKHKLSGAKKPSVLKKLFGKKEKKHESSK